MRGNVTERVGPMGGLGRTERAVNDKMRFSSKFLIYLSCDWRIRGDNDDNDDDEGFSRREGTTRGRSTS